MFNIRLRAKKIIVFKFIRNDFYYCIIFIVEKTVVIKLFCLFFDLFIVH